MRYYREHPEEPINHDWLEGAKRETAELRAKLADSFYAKSEPEPKNSIQKLETITRAISETIDKAAARAEFSK